MPSEPRHISGIRIGDCKTHTCKALPCERIGTESSHTNTQTQMTFYWDYLDQGVALAAAAGKKVSISVQAGVETPQWVYDAGAPAFNVTEQYGYSAITDGVTTAGSTEVVSAGDTAGWVFPQSVGLPISGGSIPAEATIVTVNSSSNVTISAPATESATGVAINTAHIEPMPLPWDPVFQQKWGAFVQALAARYGNAPNLAYVTMGGPGRRREAYFCFAPYDIDYFIYARWITQLGTGRQMDYRSIRNLLPEYAIHSGHGGPDSDARGG